VQYLHLGAPGRRRGVYRAGRGATWRCNRYDEALTDLRGALRFGNSPEVLTLIGECNQDLGYDDEATTYYTRCQNWCRQRLVVVVGDPYACFWLGRCYYDLDDYDLSDRVVQPGAILPAGLLRVRLLPGQLPVRGPQRRAGAVLVQSLPGVGAVLPAGAGRGGRGALWSWRLGPLRPGSAAAATRSTRAFAHTAYVRG